MNPWMLDGALHGTLDAGQSTAWTPGCWMEHCIDPWMLDGAHLLKSLDLFCKYRRTANLIQGKTKSSDLSVRYVAPRVRGTNCVFQVIKSKFSIWAETLAM